MGCFSVSCGISHITINAGERVFLVPILPNVSECEIQLGYLDDGIIRIGPASMYLDPEEFFVPFCFPIEGIYDDYGSIEEIVHNKNTDAIENFMGLPIETIVKLTTDAGNRDVYDQYSELYDVFFDQKELMKDNVCFEEFLCKIGFIEENSKFIYQSSNYYIEKTSSEGEIVYRVYLNEEHLENNLTKKVNDKSCQKISLLKLHKSITGNFLGIDNLKAFNIMSKMSGMFIHGDIFDTLSKKSVTLKDSPENFYVSKYMLMQLGFEYSKDSHQFLKDDVSITQDEHHVTIKKKNITINAYNCKDFLEAYHSLTGNDCNFTSIQDFDDSEFLFEDLLIEYRNMKTLMERLNETNYYGRKYLPGLLCFRNWKYFFQLYESQLENGFIKKAYLQYIRFYQNMYAVNAMFMPNFNGEQAGNPKIQESLHKTALDILRRK